MTIAEISSLRLYNQKISTTLGKSPGELVGSMGAMQAQDLVMAKWAVGTRLLNPSEDRIEASLNSGEIIRTHLLRPTWHFVAAQDVHWMLKLTAPQIKPLMKARQKQLELTESILSKSKDILEKILLKEKNVGREELSVLYRNAGIRTDENRMSHLMICAELDGIICSGTVKGGRQTYTLLHQRVQDKNSFTREESLAKLANRYFTSHGPATVKDFSWWSGLSISDSKKALEYIKPELISETIDSAQYWFPGPSPDYRPDKDSVFLLPAYDEFLIGYRNRSASLSLTDNPKTVSINGIFRPVIVVNGQVAGLWKRVSTKDKIRIELTLFKPINKTIRNLLEKEIIRFGQFLGKETEIGF